jgi:trimethylamine--corrinoid protein Co-methyltransferase
MKYKKTNNLSLLGHFFFTKNEMQAIHDSAMSVLHDTGVKIGSPRARQYLKDAGAYVNGDIVKIPEYMVWDAVKSAPGSFTMCGRDPEFDFHIHQGAFEIVAVGTTPEIIDIHTGKCRYPVLKDKEEFARICERTDMVILADPCTVTDVPGETESLYSLKAFANNTHKHITVEPQSLIASRSCIEMATVIRGGKEALRNRPYLFAVTAPKPLWYPEVVCDILIEMSLAGQINFINTVCMAGATGPSTKAGNIVLMLATILTGLVLAQLINKGTPCLIGSCDSIMDMRTGFSPFGNPEHNMFASVYGMMFGQFYGCTTVGAAGWTDSHCPDMQFGLDKGVGMLLAALGGINLCYGAGCISGGIAFDPVALVAEQDTRDAIRYILKGINISDETLLVDAIREIGPTGEYMSHDSTIKYMHQEHFHPKIFKRQYRQIWEKEGGKTQYDLAREKTIKIIGTPFKNPLSNKVNQQLDEIIAETEKELGVHK